MEKVRRKDVLLQATVDPIPAPPPDRDMRGADALFHLEPSREILSSFLEPRGWRLLEAYATQVQYRPGRSCLVRYLVRAAPPAGRARYLALCARVRTDPAAYLPPAPDLEDKFGLADPLEIREDLAIWAYPYDPSLASLPSAALGRAVREAAGLDGSLAVLSTPIAYRPGTRAAFRYTVLAPGGRRAAFYGKSVTADAFGRIFDAYETFHRAGVRLAQPDAARGVPGLVFFPAIEGTSLEELLVDGRGLPAPERVVRLIERLGACTWRSGADPDRPDVRIRSAGHLLAHILPWRRHEIRDAYRALAELAAKTDRDATVHGDLYGSQIFVDERNTLGLIDLEDGGPGDPLMDAANMLAHLTVMHYFTPEAGGRPAAYRVLMRDAILDGFGASEWDLNWRESYALLMLATGPFRVLRPDWIAETQNRLDSALQVLASARIAA